MEARGLKVMADSQAVTLLLNRLPQAVLPVVCLRCDGRPCLAYNICGAHIRPSVAPGVVHAAIRMASTETRGVRGLARPAGSAAIRITWPPFESPRR